jgi:hypothetical protein
LGTIRSIRTCCKKKGFLGIKFAGTELPTPYVDASLETPEAAAYVASAVAEEEVVPANLPTYGYTETESEAQTEKAAELSELENQAHAKRVLLSSDAMRFFLAKVPLAEDRTAVLDVVLDKARTTFPSEDGWVVLNLVRMEGLMEEVGKTHNDLVDDKDVDLSANTAPMTSGSLAEAILSGNLPAAYQMIALRPMLALADASADLDAVYRLKKGENATVSEMLKKQAEDLSEPQLQAAIAALTSALDGVYTDEASAVRMAIMKAVKAVSM